jgi:hypothetical protein
MSKAKLLGLAILTVGGVLGLVVDGGPAGLVFAALCLVLGLVLLVASEARGTEPASTGGHRFRPAPQITRVLILVKEVHARPQRGGKFQEIRDPDEPDLEFEVFINCWLLNETDLRLQIVAGPQLSLRTSDGSTRLGERISADLENWRLGNLVKDEWDADIVRAAQERILDLNTTDPLECGVPREGWLHYRIRNLSPSQFRTGTMELSIKDSLSGAHVGVVSGPRHLAGRVWPFVAKSASAGRSEGAATT